MTLHNEYLKVVNSLVNYKLKKENILAVILTGSVARGEETTLSDIDILFVVNKNDLSKNTRRFYNYNGKYIEEHYVALEEWDRTILKENKIIYNTNILINYRSKEYFLKRLLFAHKLWKKINLKRINYTTYRQIFGVEGFCYTLVHNLPPLFDLPFSTFRLFDSIKQIDKKLYDLCMKLHYVANPYSIKIFEKSYRITSLKIKNENLNANLGFYEPMKIKYNVDYMKHIVKNNPKQYVDRFIIGCMADWAEDSVRERLFDELIGDKEKFIKDNLDLFQQLDDRLMYVIKKFK